MQKKIEYSEYTQQCELTVVDCISVVYTKNKDVRCVLVIKKHYYFDHHCCYYYS